MIHVVIDTNVLVSAMLKRRGNEADLMLAIQAKLITPCTIDSIFAEYRRVLSSRKFHFTSAEIERTLSVMERYARFFLPGESPYRSPDPTDTKFLQCAFIASADFLVTGNKRHFPASPYGLTRVVNAPELLIHLNPRRM